MNEATFQTGDDYTSLPFTINKSAEFLNSVGMVDGIPDALDSILDDTYIKNAQK
jgi:NitT/TauT family transport system substrate-binding protein